MTADLSDDVKFSSGIPDFLLAALGGLVTILALYATIVLD